MMNRIVLFFPVFSENPDYNEVQEQIKKIYNTLCYNISSGIRGGVSTIGNDKSILQVSYNEALSALNKSDSNGGLVFASQQTSKAKQNSSHGEFKNQLLKKLSVGDSSGVKSFLELFSTELFSGELELDKIKNSFFELIVTANNTTREINKSFVSSTFDNAFATLTSLNDKKLIKDFAQTFLLECTAAISTVRKTDTNPIIKKVCDYVEENLAEDISLEMAADFAGVSSFYLSKLFKEEKGETYINDVSYKRLEKSCQLLAQTDLSIKEITATIGYNDQNYYSRIFKTKYGLSPKEYRKEKQK
jgi:two-component system response regulator YesN